jgi:hypothetical protein
MPAATPAPHTNDAAAAMFAAVLTLLLLLPHQPLVPMLMLLLLLPCQLLIPMLLLLLPLLPHPCRCFLRVAQLLQLLQAAAMFAPSTNAAGAAAAAAAAPRQLVAPTPLLLLLHHLAHLCGSVIVWDVEPQPVADGGWHALTQTEGVAAHKVGALPAGKEHKT